MQQENEIFFHSVKLLKEQTGWKDYEIAEKLGVRKTYFSELMHGREPGKKLLLRLDSLVKLHCRASHALTAAGLIELPESAMHHAERLASLRGQDVRDFIVRLIQLESDRMVEYIQQPKLRPKSRPAFDSEISPENVRQKQQGDEDLKYTADAVGESTDQNPQVKT